MDHTAIVPGLGSHRQGSAESTDSQSPTSPSIPSPTLSSSEPPEDSRSPTSKRSRPGSLKQKRSRVTPEQLVHLERFFAEDRTPSVARRKEISELLGMQERQTQIWFQNRRAKQKQQETKQKVVVPQQATASNELIIQDPRIDIYIHEIEPVTVIPCMELTIGSWKRVANATEAHDLIAYVSHSRRRLFWYIRCSNVGYKMGIPFEDIIQAQFTSSPLTPGTGCASFSIAKPPEFYVEHNDGVRAKWVECSDWSESREASTVLWHDLTGPTIQLARLLRDIRVYNGNTERVFDHSLDYRSSVGLSTPDHAMFQNPNIQAWDLSHHLHPPVSPAPIHYPAGPPLSSPSGEPYPPRNVTHTGLRPVYDIQGTFPTCSVVSAQHPTQPTSYPLETDEYALNRYWRGHA